MRNANRSWQVTDSHISAVDLDGQPVALVLAIDYGEDQTGVRLFINPEIASSAPAIADVQTSVTAENNLYFDHLVLKDVHAGRVLQDDIRFGNDFSAVMPSALSNQAQDTDADWLPDAYEISHGLDVHNSNDALEDSDQDGENNLAEYLAGTDPHNSDSVKTFAQTLKPVGYHPNAIQYWNVSYFANMLKSDQRNWQDRADRDATFYQTETDQINELGYPVYLEADQILRTSPSRLNDSAQRGLLVGRYVLSWKGEADIRMTGASFSEESTSAETGMVLDGRRVYHIALEGRGVNIDVHEIGDTPITEINAWMPDPEAPDVQSLENHLFHPAFLEMIKEREWAFIRFMGLTETNGNPEQDWGDRRLPAHAFMNGVINTRNPSPTTPLWVTEEGVSQYARGERATGLPWEHAIALANTTDRNMWINIPHLATNDYIIKLAKLFAYGSNGVEPYDAPQANPIYPPLNPNLRVFVEYSNEIWSGGNAFAQGVWARGQAEVLGISREQFIAQRFSDAWGLFEQYLPAERVVRVGAIWTSGSRYTQDLVDAWFNPELSFLQPELISPTSYFGHGLQDWVYDQNWVQDKCPDIFEGWHPCQKTDHEYWSSTQYQNNVQQSLDKFNQMALSGIFYSRLNGVDAVGLRGTFPDSVRDLSLTHNLPIVTYEGGPGFYTDYIDHGGSSDDGITVFMREVNRHPKMAEVYHVMLNQALEKGMRTHGMFTDTSGWGKYGQFGHLEYFGQERSESAKYTALLNWFDEVENIRSINDPIINNAPVFDTDSRLAHAYVGQEYQQTINISGGDGVLNVRLVGSELPAGLTFDSATLTLSGTPTEAGVVYLYLRVTDADGDPVWRTFTAEVIPEVSNSIYAFDDFGTIGDNLSGQATGSGFSTSWAVGRSDPDAFTTQITESLAYSSLDNSGGATYAIQGAFSTATRRLDSRAFDYLVNSEDPLSVGRYGTTLWLSSVIQRDVGVPLGRHEEGSETNGWIGDFLIGLAGDNRNSQRKVMIGTMSNGNFALFVSNNAEASREVIDTHISATDLDGQPVLLALAIDYARPQSTVRLYINPPITGIESSVPDVEFQTSADLSVRQVLLGSTRGYRNGHVLQDDIRLGDSFQAVVPSL